MTRLAILSDIHGNLPALEAVLRDLSAFSVDQIVVAGDVLNWGPFTNPVMERLAALGCAVIRGNNELYLTDFDTPRAPAHWQRYTIVPWTLKHLDQRWHNVIATWPDTLTLRFRDAPPVRIVHGSPHSAFEPIYPQSTDAAIAAMLDGVEETTVIAAHTHLPLDRQVGRWHIVNPGSVGVPLQGVRGANYIVLDGNTQGWQAAFRHVDYDYTPLFAEFERTGFVEACGVAGYLAVEEFRTAQVQVDPFNRWHRLTCPNEPETMALLQVFTSVDKWAHTAPAYRLNGTRVY